MSTLLNISLHIDLLPLLVVIAIAWISPVVLSFLKLGKIPSVIAEILLGYIFGRFFIDSFSAESIRILDFLSMTGFIFLMFISGLEIDIDQIISSFPRKRLTTSSFLKNPLLTGLSFFAISLILSYLSALGLSHLIHIPDVWYFSLIMVTISVGIILPVLKNRGELSTNYGQMLIITAALADILSIILFSFIAFIIKHGFHFKLLYILELFFAFYSFNFIGKKIKGYSFYRTVRMRLSKQGQQIKLRGSIVIIFIFVVIAQIIGEEEVLLGAFLSGLLLSGFMHKGRSLLLLKIDGLGFGFFIPVFFVMIGMKFELSAFAEFDKSITLFLVTLFLLLFIIKLVPSLLWSKLFGIRRALAGGFLMTTQLSLVIAASAIGMELGVVTEGINESFIVLAVITTILSPVLYNTLFPKSILDGNKTVIVGGSSTAVLLTRRLHAHGKKAIIIEKDPGRFHVIREKGLPVFHGDGTDEKIFHIIKLKVNNQVVLECGIDDINYKVARLIRDKFKHKKIIARTKINKIREQLQAMNISTVNQWLVLSSTLESLIMRPSIYHGLIESFDNFTIEDIEVQNPEIDEKLIKEIPFHPDAILMMIKSGGILKLPNSDTNLHKGDILHVFGTQSAIENTRDLVG